MNDKNVITIREKENPTRRKEAYVTITAKIIPHDPNVQMSEQVKKGASFKLVKPLVEEVQGPFDENGDLVSKMVAGKTYIFKATKFKKSAFTPIKHIWWSEQLDDGEITDLDYIKDVNPYLDDQENVCYKYKAKDCGKVRIYAYISNPIKKVSVECDVFYDDYVKAIREGRIYYTCNGGWIDDTHAFTDTKRTEYYIGAKNLWKQILEENGIKSNWENGFKVTYRQDASVSGITNLGVTKEYFVKYGLTLKEKESVALAIFQEVSIEFEDFQKFGAVIGKGASSFEPADLISNLISFYRVVKPELTKEKILELSKKLSAEESEKIYLRYPGTFTDKKYKNKVFSPKYFPNEFCKETPVFPEELQTIIPAKKDELFREWINIFDINKGVPNMNLPKY